MASRKTPKRSPGQQRTHEKRLSRKLGYSVHAYRQSQLKKASRSTIATAQALAPIAKDAKKIARQKIATPADKAKITRLSKKVKGVQNLYPIPGKQQRTYKDYQFKKGIQAIRLRNTASDSKVFFGDDGLIVTSNGRIWIYWPLDYETRSNQSGELGDAASKAFRKEFPIEQAAKLAELAFQRLKVKAVTLWTHAGRADQTFASLKQFLLWMHDKWQAGRYVRVDDNDGIVDQTDSGAWINGIAIEVEELPSGSVGNPPKKKK